MDVRAALIAAEEHLEANLRATPENALSAQEWRTNETMSIAASLFALAKTESEATEAMTHRVGRCGAKPPVIAGEAANDNCLLASGHKGWHKGETGMEWSRNHGEEVLLPMQCGHRWRWGTADNPHWEICTLGVGHKSHHSNQLTGVTLPMSDVVDPTKPIADRLHELVSHCRSEQESAIANAEQHREDSGLTARKYPEDFEAAVYRDVADKLEALLMEGGI